MMLLGFEDPVLDITALRVPAEPRGPVAPIVVTALSLLYEPVSVMVGDIAIDPDAIKLSPVALVPAFLDKLQQLMFHHLHS